MQSLTFDEFIAAGNQAQQCVQNEEDLVLPPPALPRLPQKMVRTDNKDQVIFKGKPIGKCV